MRLYVTIYENSAEEALGRIRALGDDHDGVEVRAERHRDIDLHALRAATSKPLILTHRGESVDEATIRRAIEAGIELVDVEWRPGLDGEMLARYGERIIVSHHDYHALAHAEEIVADMRSLGCAQTKLAATPETLAENERLLRLIDERTTIIGMGERGLYARILAPFRGSPLTFVAASSIAAPGQLTLERALAIYGSDRAHLLAEKVFAIAGNPASHSLSPSIHNRLFRERGLPAAYTIASFETFEEIAEAFLRGEPCGLSVTAPFKEEAFAFAQRIGASIGANARECGSVNTLINIDGSIHADNTDVDGFALLLGRVGSGLEAHTTPEMQRCSTPEVHSLEQAHTTPGPPSHPNPRIAIVGAGGTARAALVAARGCEVTLYNRTAGKLGARPLEELRHFDGEVLIDTVSAEIDLPLRRGMTYIRAAYGTPSRNVERAREIGATVLDGLALLEAQAVRQHELFRKVFA